MSDERAIENHCVAMNNKTRSYRFETFQGFESEVFYNSITSSILSTHAPQIPEALKLRRRRFRQLILSTETNIIPK